MPRPPSRGFRPDALEFGPLEDAWGRSQVAAIGLALWVELRSAGGVG